MVVVVMLWWLLSFCCSGCYRFVVVVVIVLLWWLLSFCCGGYYRFAVVVVVVLLWWLLSFCCGGFRCDCCYCSFVDIIVTMVVVNMGVIVRIAVVKTHGTK